MQQIVYVYPTLDILSFYVHINYVVLSDENRHDLEIKEERFEKKDIEKAKYRLAMIKKEIQS